MKSRCLLLIFSVALSLWTANLSDAAQTVGEPILLPGEVVFNRAGQTHRLLAENVIDGRRAGDLTTQTRFVSTNSQVATVSLDGTVTAVGNGEALIRGAVGGKGMSAVVKVVDADKPFDWSFRNHVQPVLFKMGCNTGACHGAAAGKNGFRLSLRGFDHDWDFKSLTRQAKGRRVSLAEPEQSLILLKPTMGIPHEGGERFTKGSQPYNILLEWIQAGAPPASESDRIIDRIVVIPESVTLVNGATQQVVVQAHYHDGTFEDVTPWAKYDTTDESVAVVDDQGRITVLSPGSTAITVWYSSKVSFSDVTVPRPTPVAPEVFANAERKNFIDELVLQKLESLQIAPSSKAGDTQFVRRVYLDTIGILPTPQEVLDFVLNSDPDKRAKLVDALLERPEYADYWAYKWSDLLLISSKNLPQQENLRSFYRFIRESVAANKPWDQFVRDILTAKGSTYDNGAAAFFLMHKETTALTETVSQAFLGMSITCARCHNHPLEKWTQDDYYGMANLLARITMKNGKETGSTEVQPAFFGNILHPRIGEAMPPKPLDGEAISVDAPGDRRVYLADWLTSPQNPYFTRAVVNRVWRNYMGRGLVEPEDDLRLTNPSSNAPLLEALSKELSDHAYDLKHLIRTITASAAYQRSSEPSDLQNPDPKYFSQFIIRRLKAEILLDAYSTVTSIPTDFPGYPKGFRALQLQDSQVASYFLKSFGRPERNQTCSCERTEDASIAQTLHLANGETLNVKLRGDESMVTGLAALSDREAVSQIFLKSLSRFPSAAEIEGAQTLLAGISGEGDARALARREALEDLTWAVMSSKEFLFNH